MGWLWGADWQSLFLPHTPLLEIVARGSITYLAIYTLLRIVLKRQTSGVEITDVLVIVLIADAAQNSMAGGYTSIVDGVLLVAVIIGWSALLTWLAYRFPLLRKVLNSPPLLLVQQGKMLARNMARELVTEDELMSELRLQGIEDVADVERAYMEGDGQISVVRKRHAGTNRRSPQRRTF